ncbi:transcriptional regulation of mitochondrial recombination-domain-containing protein [Staphylotrichum tortipilum]|uniref:Large ribosomal subunit protein mL67 n=1 Tax=Staphylotrichum tortipilum TaxID=2831512 RepID=A0AAN6RPW1_9PEZI|nr:transcriptional regulation of mitochondrial recombination-domain-containing protein [Staphylotrichum longicolle]
MPPKPAFPEGHGERFWIFTQIATGMTLFSLKPEIKANKAFRTQTVFTGKKLAVGKLRKDYWRTLAVVEFGEGNGVMGRSVFQKLREFQQRHLLEWGPQAQELLKMDRWSRGKTLNDQHGNTVADLAAVLGGSGKGNLIVEGREKELRWVKWTDKNGKAVGGELKLLKPKKKEGEETAVAAAGEEGKLKEGEAAKPEPLKLQPATVYWANEQDRFYAREWTDNVTHVLGLPIKEAAENALRDEEWEANAEARSAAEAQGKAAKARKQAIKEEKAAKKAQRAEARMAEEAKE